VHDERRMRFEGLFRSHADAVRGYALRRTDPDDADDVVGETFLIAWRRLDDVPASAAPWLLGVARRVLSNRRRSDRRVTSLSDRLVERERQKPDAATDDSDLLSTIEVALDRLSEKEREALRLLAWDGLSTGEAAVVLGCTRATLAVRVHRARRRLIGIIDRHPAGADASEPGAWRARHERRSVEMKERSKTASFELVRQTDPLGGSSIAGWSVSPEANAILARILDSAEPVSEASRQRRAGPRVLRVVAIAAALVLAAALGAVAGELVGAPAPTSVKRDLAGVDQGMPADLRLNPDVENAVLAASSESASLYYAALNDGGYCYEIVTATEGGRGAVCTPAADVRAQAIEITMPFTDPVSPRSPIEVGGRVNVAATSFEVRFADGLRAPIQLGANGFYLYEVPRAQVESAHVDGFDLIAYDAAGGSLAIATAPPTDFRDPGAVDRARPIFVSTISTHEDFTKVIGVEGSVNVDGARRLELRYPDGSTKRIPIRSDGSYHYDLPVDRLDDLASLPGELIAYDADGEEIARAPVASVAYWHSGG
jgi:RNA polymerase sigma-70 factor, ECF subfamily